MKSNTSPTVEFVLFEMHMKMADLVRENFTSAFDRALETIGGTELFNLKLDDSDPFQRCSAVLLGQEEQDECVALAFLSKDGRRVTVQNAADSGHPLATRALQERQQATEHRQLRDAAVSLQHGVSR